MRHFYSLLLFLFAPVLVAFTWLQKRRRGGGSRFITQRLGLYRQVKLSNQQPVIWFHAASVGETKAIQALVNALWQSSPDSKYVVTTNTAEAAELVESQFPSAILHLYMAIDFPHAVARLIDSLRPRALFVVETEIWPNLFHHCFIRNIPITIINGRLSDKTVHSNLLAKSLYRQALPKVNMILARSGKDAENYALLGANKKCIEVFGNIKFVSTKTLDIKPIEELQNRNYLLALSTHPGEEVLLANACQQLDQPVLLTIVPRHPARGDAIERSLRELKLHVSIRSRGDSLTPQTDIYLADTTGEVSAFLAGNTPVVFVGGSLVPHGGHNVLEPAMFGKAIVTGPHVGNFEEEVGMLVQANAICKARSEDEFIASLKKLVASPENAQELGENARNAMRSCANIFDRYLSRIQEFIAEPDKKRDV